MSWSGEFDRRRQWPKLDVAAEHPLSRYYNAILDLATRFMKVVALSLGLKEGAFDELCRLPAAAIRLLYVYETL